MDKLHSSVRKLLIGYACLLVIAAAVTAGFWRFKHIRLLSVQTNSMAPAYVPGDALLVSPAVALHPGEIISYESPKDPRVIVSHRLLAEGSLLITQGDNLARPDVSFARSLVVGQVDASLPRLGYVIDFLHRPVGMVAVVYLPALVVILGEARRLAKHYSRGYYRLFSFR